MAVATVANLAARFVLELAGIGAVGYSAFQLTASQPLQVLAALGAVAAFVTVWAIVVAPNAANAIGQTSRIFIGSGMLLASAWALGVAGRPDLALGLGLAVVANTVLLVILGHDVSASTMRSA